MRFTDETHSVADVVFQGADDCDISETCTDELLSILDSWVSRPDDSDTGINLFRLPDMQGFSITYDGRVTEYWPDEATNLLDETLIRDFLFSDGICVLSAQTPILYRVKYKLEALEDLEYLLVCPYLTTAGNIGGIVVVCVDRHVVRRGAT